jgi:hypothetical protein
MPIVVESKLPDHNVFIIPSFIFQLWRREKRSCPCGLWDGWRSFRSGIGERENLFHLFLKSAKSRELGVVLESSQKISLDNTKYCGKFLIVAYI